MLGSGIGREAGYTFAERGANGVVFADINKKDAQDAAEASQKLSTNTAYRAIALHVDVTDRASVQKIVAAAHKEFGRIDYSINSAGVCLRELMYSVVRRKLTTYQVGAQLDTPLTDMPTEEFDRVHNVNARGTFFCTAEVAKIMQGQDEKFTEGRSGRRSIGRGIIINILSLNAQLPVSGHGQYGSSKYAALGVTETAGKLHPGGRRIMLIRCSG